MQWIGNSKTESQGDLGELKQMVYTKVHKCWSVKMLIKSCTLSSCKQGTCELSSPCANPIDDYCHGAINERAKPWNPICLTAQPKLFWPLCYSLPHDT